MPRVRHLRSWYQRRPLLTGWAILAVGMLLMLTVFSVDAGLTPRQFVAVAGATLLMAWLCAWVITLEDAEHP